MAAITDMPGRSRSPSRGSGSSVILTGMRCRPRWLLLRILAYRVQVAALGGLDKETLLILRQPKGHTLESPDGRPFEARIPTTREGARLTAGALLAREWNGNLERVMVLERGFAWNGETYGSLSQVAKAMTGTNWNGRVWRGLDHFTAYVWSSAVAYNLALFVRLKPT